MPLCLPAAAATVLVVVATRNGVGLSADSAHYIGAARELAAGHGLVVPWGEPAPRPLLRWPPLYPAVLAAVDAAGPDPVVSVRWLHALLYGLTVFVFGRLILTATRSIWLGFLCAALLAAGGNLLRVHMMAWSEPLFLCLAALATAALVRWCHMGGTVLFVSAASLFGLAALTRFAGVGLALGAGLGLLTGWGDSRRRIGSMAAFGLISAAPLTMWMAWQLAAGEMPAARPATWSPRFAAIVAEASTALARLLLPDSLPGPRINLLLLAAVAAGMLLVMVGARRRLPFREDVGLATLRHRACWLLAASIAGYSTFFVASGVAFDPAINFADVRHAVTPLVLGSWLFVLGAFDVWEREGRRPMLAATALSGGVGLCMLMAPRAIDFSERLASGSGAGGQGYHDGRWQASPTLAALQGLPSGTPIYSNAPDAVYLLTGRPSIWLPRREAWRAIERPVDSINAQASWRAAIDDLRASLTKGARIVFLDRVAWRGASPDSADLEHALPIRAEVKTEDGRIYAWTGEAE